MAKDLCHWAKIAAARERETWVCNGSLGRIQGTKLERQHLVADKHPSLTHILAFLVKTDPMGAEAQLLAPFPVSVCVPLSWSN